MTHEDVQCLMRKIPIPRFSDLSEEESFNLVHMLRAKREEAMKKKPKPRKSSPKKTKTQTKAKTRSSSKQKQINDLAKLVSKLSPDELEKLRSQLND